MKIYTRTGDKGKTGLFGGKRVAKNDVRVEAYGTVDELNSAIGLAITPTNSYSSSEAKRSREVSSRQARTISKLVVRRQARTITEELTKIQGDLFEVAAVLATPARARVKEKRIHEEFASHLTKRVDEFEKLIDSLTSHLKPLTSFILPGGSKGGAFLHLARSISRRAERRIVALSQKEHIDEAIIMYMNRLSDLLFTMARFVNKQKRIPETPWKGLK